MMLIQKLIGVTESGLITAIYCAVRDSIRIKGKQMLFSYGAVIGMKTRSSYFRITPQVLQKEKSSEERLRRSGCGAGKFALSFSLEKCFLRQTDL